MKNWFNSLTPRERNLVSYGSIIAAIILFWLLILNPLYTRYIHLNNEIQSKTNALERMKSQRVRIRELQQQKRLSGSKNSTGNPQQLVENALQTWRLKPALQRMQSQGQNAVRLTLKDADAGRFMRFLQDLENKFSLAIENMSIIADKNPGLVDVRLTVKR